MRSHFTDLISRPVLRFQGSSLSWASFHLPAKHVLQTTGSIPWDVSPFTKVWRKQCAASPEEKIHACPIPGTFTVMPVIRSTPCTFSRKLWCGLRDQILTWFRHISSLWHSLCHVIPLHHHLMALSPQAHPINLNWGHWAAKALLLLVGTGPGAWGWHCPSDTASCCFSPLEVDVTYLSCMHRHWSTQSFHTARGRAVWSQDTIPEGLSAAGAFLQKPSMSLYYKTTKHQIPLKTSLPLLQIHQIMLRNKHYIITIWGLSFFLTSVFWFIFTIWKEERQSVSSMLEVCMEKQEETGED